MKEAYVRVRCDKCKEQIDEDTDPIERTIGWLGQEYEVDLCDTCVVEVDQAMDWLPVPKNRVCPECHRTFATFQAMMIHRSRKHDYESPTSGSARARKKEVEKGPYACPECGKEFDKRQPLGTHRWSAHRTRSPVEQK